MTRSRRILALTAATLAALAPGCSYARQRVVDFSETFHVGLSASVWPCLYVYGQAPLFATSLGYVPDSIAIGNDYGYEWAWHQGAFGLVLGGQNVRSQIGYPVAGFLDGRLTTQYLDQSHFLVLNLVATDRRTSFSSSIPLTKFEVGAQVLFVGASVGVDVAEVLDFVTGIFGWDLLGDDDFVPTYLPPPDEPARRDGEPPADETTSGKSDAPPTPEATVDV